MTKATCERAFLFSAEGGVRDWIELAQKAPEPPVTSALNSWFLMKILLVRLALVVTSFIGLVPARAVEPFGPHPVHLVVPSVPGGVHDVVGRLWAERARAQFSSLVIDNHGGVGGYIGALDVARSKADGNTLLLGSTSTQVLVPAQNLTDLVAYVRANPGKVSYGSTGMGSVTHMAGESFRRMAGGLDIAHVPYKGVGQGIADLLAGQILMMTPNATPQIIQLHRGGRIRILAVLGNSRLSAAPEIPTSAEAGMPGLLVPMFFGIFVPAGTPVAVVRQLDAINQRVIADPSFQQTLIAGGFQPMPGMGPERTRQYVSEEITRWTPIIKSTGATMD